MMTDPALRHRMELDDLRSRLIESMCFMYRDLHNTKTTPDWLVEIHNETSTGGLVDRMNIWKVMQPQMFYKYGINVL